MPGQEHGDALGDVRADQVAGGGAPAIVEEAGGHPGRLAGRAPRGAPAADGDTVPVEDERAVRVAACPPPRQGLGDGRRDGEDASHQRFRAGRREPDDAAGPVDLVPGEAEDLLLAPPPNSILANKQSGNMVMAQSRASLRLPLKFRDALADLLQVEPPPKKNAPKKRVTKKKRKARP